jgi:Transposase
LRRGSSGRVRHRGQHEGAAWSSSSSAAPDWTSAEDGGGVRADPGPGRATPAAHPHVCDHTKGLVALRDWLASQQVRVVGVESTGAWWKAVCYRLETTMDCWGLLAAGARHLRNVPGRKTDVADAAWICQLVEHGLVRPSFVPPRRSASCATSPATPKTVIQERTREAQRLEQAAGGRRHPSCRGWPATSWGSCGRAVLQALVAGVRDPSSWPSRQGPPARQAPPPPRGPGRPLRPHHGLLVGEMLTPHRRRRRHHPRPERRDRCPGSRADVVSGTGSCVGSRASRITPGHHLRSRRA